jgi:alcohol dehydrogenase (cytochrome c)
MKEQSQHLYALWSGFLFAQTAEDLLTAGKNTDNVPTFGMGYDLKMFSSLTEINKSNIKRLVPVWNFSLSNDMGELSQADRL